MSGRVTLVDGETFYSPNAQCDLEISGETNNASVFVLGHSTARDFQKPRFWTAETEWLSCVPTMPVSYNGILTETLAHIPRRFSHTVAGEYYLPDRVVSRWLVVEKTLEDVVDILREGNTLTFTRPFPPRSFKYDMKHTDESFLHKRVALACDWFAIWLGLLFWQIHQIHDPDHIEGLTPAKWVVQVAVARKFSQALLDGLRTAPLLQRYWAINRAGIVLHSPPLPSQPSPEYFITLNIPVWYHWNSMTDSSFPAPTSYELQLAATWISKEPQFPPTDHRALVAFSGTSSEQQQTSPEFAEGFQTLEWELEPDSSHTLNVEETDFDTNVFDTDNDMAIDPPAAAISDIHCHLTKKGRLVMKYTKSGRSFWEPYFEKRAKLVASLLKTESAKDRQKREARERQPPTASAPVYVWEWDIDDPTIFRRIVVRKDERQYTLAAHGKAQKRYCAVLNEWDCCDEWGSDKEESDSDSDYDDEPATTEPRPTQLVLVTTHPWESDQFLSDNLRCNVLEILHSQFGFSLCSSLSDTDAVSSPVDGRSLVHALGITWTPMDNIFFSTSLGQYCINFLACFSNKVPSAPPLEDWDMAPTPHSMLKNSHRLQCLRVVGNKTEELYMFDFGEESTVPWRLAVYTATAALTVCRMDPDMKEKDLAIELILSGTRFRTIQPAETVEYITPEPRFWSRSIPIRVLDHKFTKTDFEFYQNLCQGVLKQRRGRAALLHGGFVYRIAIDVVGKQEALSGPIGQYHDSSQPIFSVKDAAGNEYLDDELTQDELDIICGLYVSYIDNTAFNIRKESWFPLAHLYDGSGEDLGRWSNRGHDFYNRRVECMMGGVKYEKMDYPWTPAMWRQELRGAPVGRRAMKCLEDRSKSFINQFGPLAARR